MARVVTKPLEFPADKALDLVEQAAAFWLGTAFRNPGPEGDFEDLPVEPNENLGGCPYCGGTEGWAILGKTSLAMCAKHKVAWIIGWGLPSKSEPDSPEYQLETAQILAEYTPVTPRYRKYGNEEALFRAGKLESTG